MDVILAFLHTELVKEIYIKQPQGYVNKDKPDQQLQSHGFIPLNANPCIYMLARGEDITIIAIHIYNCTIAASKSLLQVAKDSLMAKFNMQDLGEATSVLRMEIIQCQVEGKLLQMKGYIN